MNDTPSCSVHASYCMPLSRMEPVIWTPCKTSFNPACSRPMLPVDLLDCNHPLPGCLGSSRAPVAWSNSSRE